VTDGELVERARNGDHEAFGQLVDRHQSAVRRAAAAVLGGTADADDAAQDAFVTAFRRLESFRGDASFRTWILAIAWRKGLDRRARVRVWPLGRRAATGDVDCEPFDAVQDPAPGQEDRLLRSELAGHIRRLVGSLPRRYRDVLLLTSAGEFTLEEIGRMLGVPTGTVKWRAMDARRQIRDKLARLGLVGR
jgi:RNA polymerase sigma-70 factor (ECF subfamily)